MHCPWHYHHWKILRSIRKGRLTFLLVERKKRRQGKNHSEFLLMIDLLFPVITNLAFSLEIGTAQAGVT